VDVGKRNTAISSMHFKSCLGHGFDSLFKVIITIVMTQIRLNVAVSFAGIVFSSLHLHLFTASQDNFPVVFYDSFVFV
jgi:hypothetical protein